MTVVPQRWSNNDKIVIVRGAQMTKAIVDIASPLGISVHDHIIVGKNGHASMKGLKLI